MKLLTCGCSFVWGDELPGCYDNPPTHQKLTFTYHLAKKLGVKPLNIAACGNGNEKIFRDTIEALAKNDDITHVVVLWSAWQRNELAEGEHELDHKEYEMKVQRSDWMTQFSADRINWLASKRWGAMHQWYNICQTYKTDVIHGLAFMLALQDLGDAKGIKLVHGVFHERNLENIRMIYMTNRPEWQDYTTKISDMFGRLRKSSRVGLGVGDDLYSLSREKIGDLKFNGHPGEESHSYYAELLHHLFQKYY